MILASNIVERISATLWMVIYSHDVCTYIHSEMLWFPASHLSLLTTRTAWDFQRLRSGEEHPGPSGLVTAMQLHVKLNSECNDDVVPVTTDNEKLGRPGNASTVQACRVLQGLQTFSSNMELNSESSCHLHNSDFLLTSTWPGQALFMQGVRFKVTHIPSTTV